MGLIPTFVEVIGEKLVGGGGEAFWVKDSLILCEKDLEFHELRTEEFKTTFKSFKRNKVVRDNDVNINIVYSVYNEINFHCQKFFQDGY